MPRDGMDKADTNSIEAFIRENLVLASVPLLPAIRLYTSHPGSALWRLAKPSSKGSPPYWAYRWAGGMALALHFTQHTEGVSGRRILDLGAGSGLVGIAAAKAGAGEIIALDSDSNACAACALNAVANDVSIRILCDDLLAMEPPEVDVVAVGDLFYDSHIVARVLAFLERCQAAGADILIGDPWRAHLPRARLRLIAEYMVPDVGTARDYPTVSSGVFELAGSLAAS